jgi:hypothetical protein|tara:strand:- start:2292 stop:2759 length:468 start_codon:yes stop_codon:yes gene_type:complete
MADRIRYNTSAFPIVTMTDGDANDRDAIHHDINTGYGISADHTKDSGYDWHWDASFNVTNTAEDVLKTDQANEDYKATFIAMKNIGDGIATTGDQDVLLTLDGTNYYWKIEKGQTLLFDFNNTEITMDDNILAKTASGTSDLSVWGFVRIVVEAG